MSLERIDSRGRRIEVAKVALHQLVMSESLLPRSVRMQHGWIAQEEQKRWDEIAAQHGEASVTNLIPVDSIFKRAVFNSLIDGLGTDYPIVTCQQLARVSPDLIDHAYGARAAALLIAMQKIAQGQLARR